VLQYRVTDNSNGISRVAVGSINAVDNLSFEYINDEGNDTTFPGNAFQSSYILSFFLLSYLSSTIQHTDGIPSDGTPLEVISHFHLALIIFYDILAFLGLVYTTVCLVFNFVFRKRK
jgi:hypothetical protein